MSLPVFLTTVPLAVLFSENLFYLEVFSFEGKKLIFFFDDKNLWKEMHELFIRLQKGKEASVKEPTLSYTEVEKFSGLPKDCLVYSFGKSDVFYCIRLYNINPLTKKQEEFSICFEDRSFANWFASIVDKAMKLRLKKFGMG